MKRRLKFILVSLGTLAVFWLVAGWVAPQKIESITLILSSQLTKISGFIKSNVLSKKQKPLSEEERSRLSAELKVLQGENLRLKSLLSLREQYPEKSLAARVIAGDPTHSFQILWINVGSNDGVQINANVLTPEGLVGRVVKVLPHQAKVLSIQDPQSVLEVWVEGKKVRGMVSGKSKLLSLDKLSQEILPQEGDILITTGLDPFFRAGIPVGKIQRVGIRKLDSSQEIEILPWVDKDEVREVLVVNSRP
ncbi:MAG: rod shape-determining protein MreC [Deltaproteobacteria bacterium]|nr:rod shape-determining protein MreC [Deltaproteobacteria bacterium]